jgi:predicted nucleic acid-binding protein
MYLLDTVTLSELRKRRPDSAALAWLRRQSPRDLFLSVLTLGEIERGIAAKGRSDQASAARLQEWLDGLLLSYVDRILPVTIGIARRWGRLADQIGNAGVDLVIAATALEHGLAVVTRNERHFGPTGVAVVNPFSRP